MAAVGSFYRRVLTLASPRTRPFTPESISDVCVIATNTYVITRVQFTIDLMFGNGEDGTDNAFATLTIVDASHTLVALFLDTSVMTRTASLEAGASFSMSESTFNKFLTSAASVYLIDTRDLTYHFRFNIADVQYNPSRLSGDVIGPLKPDPMLCKAFEIKLIAHPFSVHEHENYVLAKWNTEARFQLGFIHELHELRARLIVADEPISALLQNSFYLMLAYFGKGHHRKAKQIMRWMDQHIHEMPEPFKVEHLIYTCRMTYNLGKFDAALARLKIARSWLRDSDANVLADCWFESALIYAHKGDSRSARASFTNAMKHADFTTSNPKLFAKSMLYAVLCIAFLGDPFYQYVTRIGCNVSWNALEELEKIASARRPVVTFGFNAWACEALVRGRLKLIEHLSLSTLVPPISHITSELLQCLNWLQEGFRLCRDYNIVVNLPGMFKAGGMLASITDSPISMKAGPYIAELIGFTFHTEDHDAWRVNLPHLNTNSETRASMKTFLETCGWHDQWDYMLKDYGLPRDDSIFNDAGNPNFVVSDVDFESDD